MALIMWLVSVIIPLVTIVLYYVRRNLMYWQNRGIPHTTPHPLWGNIYGWRKTKILGELMEVIYKKHKGSGPFCGFYFFQRPSVLVLDTALAKNVLIKDFANFADRGVFYNERDDPLTAHLFALDGVKWKNMRQKLSPTFTSGKMKFMFPTIVRVAEEFVKVFGEVVQKNSHVEIKDLMARFTTDVIGTCAFGIECNSLRNPNAEFRAAGTAAFTKTRHSDLINGFLQSFPDLARRLGMRQIHEDVHQFYMRIVRETVALREQNNIKRHDFMDLLIELKNNKDADGLGGLTVEQVAAQAFLFLAAGFETSSTAMGFAMYELARHTDWQDKLREEINGALEKHGQQFTYECMKDLQLTEQVLAETLRLYTSLPLIQRKAINDYVVPGYPKYVIEKGTAVLIPTVAFHHDPDYYPEPYEFKPERFSPEMVQQRDSVEWLPFGDGPRNCIGLRFGKMQAIIGLAFLLRNFQFSVCPETKIPMEFDLKNFLLSAKGGIVLKVEKI